MQTMNVTSRCTFLRRSLGSFCLAAILGSFSGCSADSASAPAPDNRTTVKSLLVFYGWPNGINGADKIAAPTDALAAAAADFGKYDYVVLGAGLEKTGHGAHDITRNIIAHDATADTFFFGYVDLGVTQSTSNFDMVEIKTRVDEWIATGADGIFLDDFGFDYGVTRERQNEAVAYIHNKGLPVVANAWVPADVFGRDVVADSNPTGVAPKFNSRDFYLAESYQITVGDYQTESAWQDKILSLKDYQKSMPFRILAMTTNAQVNTYDENKFFYAWYSAVMYGCEAVGWGEYLFASSDNLAPYRARPAVALGASFTGAVTKVGDEYRRSTDSGYVWVNPTAHTAGFAP